MAGGLMGRLGMGVAGAWGWACSCASPPEEAMPDYEGLPRRFRPPKKKLSHISEGRESLMTRTAVQTDSEGHKTSPLDEASMAEHNERLEGLDRFYAPSSQSLPSTNPEPRDKSRHSGEVRSKANSSISPHLSSTPQLSGSADNSRDNSRRHSSSTETAENPRHSLEAMRPSFESGRSSITYAQESVGSGQSWVPDLPSYEALTQRRRRRSTDMLSRNNQARQRVWEGRDIMASVQESQSPYAQALTRGDSDGGRMDAYLDEQRRRAPLDARRRLIAHQNKAVNEIMPPDPLPTNGLDL